MTFLFFFLSNFFFFAYPPSLQGGVRGRLFFPFIVRHAMPLLCPFCRMPSGVYFFFFYRQPAAFRFALPAAFRFPFSPHGFLRLFPRHWMSVSVYVNCPGCHPAVMLFIFLRLLCRIVSGFPSLQGGVGVGIYTMQKSGWLAFSLLILFLFSLVTFFYQPSFIAFSFIAFSFISLLFRTLAIYGSLYLFWVFFAKKDTR